MIVDNFVTQVYSYDNFDLSELTQLNNSKGCDEEGRRESINTEKCCLLRGT